MNIGFDAKRAFHNETGLGNYSRSLLLALSAFYPEHAYYLFNPEDSVIFHPTARNMHEVQPESFFHRLLRSAWRSSWVKKDLAKLNIQLYHGLSHEIPLGIQHTNTRAVVTMHDLIHERFPEQYSFTDAGIYRKKFRNACAHAGKIIAISEQTKKDLIEYYKVPADKITVCYQSCNPDFAKPVSPEEIQKVKEVYQLPDKYFLYVGSIIERKNLLNICKALQLLRNEINIPLVVVGDGKQYKLKVKEYLKEHDLADQVIFLSERQPPHAVRYSFAMLDYEESIYNLDQQESISKEEEAAIWQRSQEIDRYRHVSADLPAIYQSAIAMLYPSFFEGFGIPVLEALWSKLPVITSNVSSLPEAGGDGAYYVDPSNAEEIAEGMRSIYSDKELVSDMTTKGWAHAQNFTPQKHAEAVMNVYKSLF